MSKKRSKIRHANMSISHSRAGVDTSEIDWLVGLINNERYDEAIIVAEGMTERFPKFGVGWKVLGVALHQKARSADAIEPMQKSVALLPGDAEAHCNLGAALQTLGRLTEAAKSYRRALEINPDFALTHFNLGSALQNQGHLRDAMASYRRALEIHPGYAAAHLHMGNALRDLGRLDDAVRSYTSALEFAPDFAEAHFNLGNALNDLGLRDGAVVSYRRALEIKHDFAAAHGNLGNVLKSLGRLDEALVSYDRALAVMPEYVAAHSNRGNALRELGRLDDAIASYRSALAITPDFAEVFSNLLFVLAYHALVPVADIFAESLQWQKQVMPAAKTLDARDRAFTILQREGRRLRIGYVSGDYRQHPVSHFVEPLFRLHDRSRIELFAYSTNSSQDEITLRLKSLVDHWIPIAGLNDEAARKQIETDSIDVLIDLSGHTEHNRLGVFALRAAPVQAHYLGYFASTGLAEMDYWIGDPVILPESEDAYYSERIWRLNRSWVSYQGREDAPLSKWSPERDGTVWLGSFNNWKKATPASLATWAKILKVLPNARLLLKSRGLEHPANSQKIVNAMAGHGIDTDRLELATSTDDWSSHMAVYDRLDIALDPIGGVGGGTTTCDALWMGVPVVTMIGQQMTQRMTASMLNAIGHPEWVAANESDYVNTVVELAKNVSLRQYLRADQRDKMRSSELCDAAGLARSLEDAYETMFDIWWQKKQGITNSNSQGVNTGE
jgi:protein O-GlcNAc transferase